MEAHLSPRRSVFAVWHWPRWTWAIVVVLMLVGYPLSIGPAYWMLGMGVIPQTATTVEFLRAFYYPLNAASENSEWLRTAIDRYHRFWAIRRKYEPPSPPHDE